MYEYEQKERPWYQATGHTAEWMNNKKREAIEILRGMHDGYTPLMAINAAERIVNEILNDGFTEMQVGTIRMHIEEVRRNLRRPLMLGEDAFSKLIIPGGE